MQIQGEGLVPHSLSLWETPLNVQINDIMLLYFTKRPGFREEKASVEAQAAVRCDLFLDICIG
jgi:hypothetical protein